MADVPRKMISTTHTCGQSRACVTSMEIGRRNERQQVTAQKKIDFPMSGSA